MLLLIATTAAQPTRPVEFKYNEMPPLTLGHFFRSWLGARESLIDDDTTAVYILQGVRWRGPDSVVYSFVVDSIKGRGAERKVLLTRSNKTTDSTSWVYRKHLDIAFPDTSVHYIPDSLATLTTPTADSTYRVSFWLGYMPLPSGGWFMHMRDTLGVRRTLIIRLLKVIGDPTKNYGRNQQALLITEYKQSVPTSMSTFIDSLDASIGPIVPR